MIRLHGTEAIGSISYPCSKTEIQIVKSLRVMACGLNPSHSPSVPPDCGELLTLAVAQPLHSATMIPPPRHTQLSHPSLDLGTTLLTHSL